MDEQQPTTGKGHVIRYDNSKTYIINSTPQRIMDHIVGLAVGIVGTVVTGLISLYFQYPFNVAVSNHQPNADNRTFQNVAKPLPGLRDEPKDDGKEPIHDDPPFELHLPE